MCDKGFASVVDWLIGWHVDDVGAHTGCDDEVAKTLTLEDLAGVFGRKDHTINCIAVRDAMSSRGMLLTIHRHLFLVFIEGLLQDRF